MFNSTEQRVQDPDFDSPKWTQNLGLLAKYQGMSTIIMVVLLGDCQLSPPSLVPIDASESGVFCREKGGEEGPVLVLSAVPLCQGVESLFQIFWGGLDLKARSGVHTFRDKNRKRTSNTRLPDGALGLQVE